MQYTTCITHSWMCIHTHGGALEFPSGHVFCFCRLLIAVSLSALTWQLDNSLPRIFCEEQDSGLTSCLLKFSLSQEALLIPLQDGNGFPTLGPSCFVLCHHIVLWDYFLLNDSQAVFVGACTRVCLGGGVCVCVASWDSETKENCVLKHKQVWYIAALILVASPHSPDV